MTRRTASCQCGALTATCIGDPARVSVCHCLACQKRSGSSFAAHARFPAKDVQLSGERREWTRTGDEGSRATHHFCPACGSTVWFVVDADPDTVAIAVGAFAEPAFPAPAYSVYEERKHGWVAITGEGVEHYD